MHANRGRTRPERELAGALWRKGFRYLTPAGYKARFGKRLVGQPDVIFLGTHVALFMDGCFWHGCECRGGIPTQSGEFWQRKIAGNVERDKKVTARLEADGWKVLRVPEHELQTAQSVNTVADVIAAYLQSL